MIYLDNSNEIQEVNVPRVLTGGGQGLTFRIVGIISKEVYSFEVEDWQVSELYHFFEVQLPEGLESGEYEYTLSAGDEVLSTGLLMIGLNGQENTEYQKNIQYEQYQK